VNIPLICVSSRQQRITTLVFLFIFLLFGCGRKDESPPVRDVIRPVKVMVLGDKSASDSRQFPGTVRAAERAELAFQVSGKLVKLPVKEGQKIKKGTLIAKLDPRDFKANVQSTKAQNDAAKANYARGKELVSKGFISKVDFDKLKERRDVTAAELTKAKKSLDDSVLRAPFSGVAARRYVENFQEIQAKDPIVSLQNNATLEIVVAAPEQIVARVRDVSKANIVAMFESVPGQLFDLTLKEFATEADPKTQTFQYVFTMPQPKGVNIRPGMTATVSATRTKIEDKDLVFVVPALAVFADGKGESHIWVVNKESNTVKKRKVTTGNLAGSDKIKVIDGLFPGDMIVVAGVSQLREGMTIRPVDKIEF